MSVPNVDVDAVRRLVEGDRRPGDVVGADDLQLAPDAHRLAFTADVVDTDGSLRRQVGVLELVDGELDLGLDASGDSRSPAWSPDGTLLAWLSTSVDGTDAVCILPWAERRTAGARTVPVEGAAEYLRWSPDGTRLLIGAAAAGAARSDVFGSGTVATAGSTPSWYPLVEDGRPAAGRRRPIVLDVESGQLRAARVDGVNVWDAAWAGVGAVVALVSDHPDESDWYDARLMTWSEPTARGVPSTAQNRTVPVTAPGQVAAPGSSPDGSRISAIVGAMSDRGLETGGLWVDGDIVDTLGVDVTQQRWLDDDTVLWTGLRGLRTVAGTWDARHRRAAELWSSDDTCGRLNPAVTAAAGMLVACVHGHDRPPALTRIAPDEQVLLPLTIRAGRVGTTTRRTWTSSDGTQIEGLLTQPDADGPHALVVLVHGGPVWAWRNTWAMNHPYTSVLVAAGYAVLHPNGRGSSGRGQQFVRDGLYDMGAVDADDLLFAVDALIADGSADPDRVAVSGNSYGGFMSSWLPTVTDRFAAVVARSPVTDWVSQHHMSNLAGFDQLCFPGDPLAPEALHRARSPLYRADRIHSPAMLMAGAGDLATPAGQAVALHRALVERGRTSVLVVYPEEGHGVRAREALIDQCGRMVEFLNTHVGRRSGS